MGSNSLAIMLSIGLWAVYGRRLLRHYFLTALDNRSRVLLTAAAAFNTVKIIIGVLHLLGDFRYPIARVVNNYITTHRPKIDIECHIPFRMFEAWLEAHIRDSRGKTLLRHSLILLNLQLLVGKTSVVEEQSVARWIERFGDPEGARITSVRTVFCYDGHFFMRAFTEDGPTLLALNGTAATIRSLVQDITTQIRKSMADFGNPVSIFLNLGGRGWHFHEIKSFRPFKNVYMLEDDRKHLLKRIHGTMNSFRSSTGNRKAKRLLLYGDTGTGKSTLSLALAGHLGLKARCFLFSNLERAESFKVIDLLAELGTDSVLILDEVTRRQMRHSTLIDNGISERELDESNLISDPEARRKHIIDALKSGLYRSGGQMLTVPIMFQLLDKLTPREHQPLVICNCRTITLSNFSINPAMFDVSQRMDKLNEPTAAQLFKYMYQYLPAVEPHLRTKQQINTLADRFAKTIWENAVTPAAVQSYILPNYSEDPQGAVDNIATWCSVKLGGQQPQTGAAAPDFDMDGYGGADGDSDDGQG